MNYFRLSRNGKWTTGKRVEGGRIAVEHWISKDGYLTQSLFHDIESNSDVDVPKLDVPVVYLPTNPQIACACHPYESLVNLTYTISLWASLIALLVTFGYHHFRKDYWDE